MLSRFEYSIATGNRIEIAQIVYRNDSGETIALDVGTTPPQGFSEFSGDLYEESQPKEVEKE